MDEILRCNHSNETSLSLLSHCAISFTAFYQNKIGNFVEISLWPLLAAKGLIIPEQVSKIPAQNMGFNWSLLYYSHNLAQVLNREYDN